MSAMLYLGSTFPKLDEKVVVVTLEKERLQYQMLCILCS